ncbi:MAG: putative metal-binding motif-containing protein [Deltaproteobacteria bacterium]|nr:putative metal-binding motif-containing protein [Deltaproteobacteria bacterium]
MSKKKLSFLLALTSSLFLTASTSYAFGDFGADVNAACAPAQPFTGSCTLCHTGGYSASTPAKTAFLSGGSALTNYFCPSGPTCTDSDNDSFALEGGACGPVDCNDANGAVNPSAAENCTDGIDNDCDGLIDAQDPSAVGCPPVCTDSDGDSYSVQGGLCGPVDCNDNNAAVNPGAAEVCGDGIDNTCNGVVDEGCPTAPVCTDNDGDTFALEGGECGVVDCDDTDAAVHPSAVEDCTDGIDNNCNGLVDAQDGGAVNCPAVCTDGDGDSYAVEGGECGPVDCNDADATVNPGAAEICADSVDNDCDSQVDEGCDPACPDADGDGFTDAACGGNDCNDLSAAINPGASEVCGNGVDENCNGSSDDTCLTCPEGGVLSITDARYKERELDVKGRSHLRTRISIVDADSGQVLAENIRVDGGKWKAEIEKLARGYVPETIKAINTEGCETEKDVTVKGRPQREDDDDRDDD